MESVLNPFNHVLVQALELSPHERLRLIEQIAASVGGELAKEKHVAEEHWGKSLNAFMKTLDMSEWKEIDDPEIWLQEQRENALRERLGDWGKSE
jgi:hypothetical protein